MQNGDEASPSIILAGRALLVKMLKPLEPCCAFDSNFVYLCIITMSSHWYAKWRRGFTEHHLADRALLVKMHITLGPHGILCSHFVYLCILNIAQPLICKMGTRLHRASFGRSSSFSQNAHNSRTAWYILFKYCILLYFNIV